LKVANHYRLGDVILLSRGGGSIEDLWAFNHEELAHTIARSEIPVVSAVGHEIDFTIADFVADLRAPTPSAAAELVVPDSVELAHRLDGLGAALERVARETVERWKAHLAFILRSVLFREPKARLDALAQDLDDAEERLKRATRAQLALSAQQVATLRSSLREHRPDHLIALRRQQLEQLAEHLTRLARQQREAMAQRLEHGANLLRILGPQATLSRGYSITRTAAGELVHSAGQVRPGTEVVTQLAEGRITSTVTGGGGTH
jgi:exodeoxyribonuclease VII large subunit